MRRLGLGLTVALVLLASVVTAYQAEVDVLQISTAAGIGEEPLATYTLPALKLDQDGKVVRFTFWGSTANNTRNGKVVRFYFGGTSYVVSTGAVNAQGWRGVVECLRLSATAQRCAAQTATGGVSGASASALSPSEDLTGNVTIKITGTNGITGSADVTKSGLIVEYLN